MSDIVQRIRTKYSSEPGVPIGELFQVPLSKEDGTRFRAFLEVSGRIKDHDILSSADILSWLLLQENLEECNNRDSLLKNVCKMELSVQDSYKYNWDEGLDERFKKLSPDKQMELRQNAASFLEEAQKFVASKAAAIKKERQEEEERAKQPPAGKRPPNWNDDWKNDGRDGC